MTLLTNIDNFGFIVSFNKYLLSFLKISAPILAYRGASMNKTDKGLSVLVKLIFC